MDQSLSITLVLEGGLPQTYLSVQDNYNSQAQVFNVPLEFIDVDALVNSAKNTGDYWIVTSSPDNPRFQTETAIFVRHHNDKIVWDLVYEHYEPFLNIELGADADDFDENIISFTFAPFQYSSALYQACKLSQEIEPTTFRLAENSTNNSTENLTDNSTGSSTNSTTDDGNHANPVTDLARHIPKLNILWQRHGIAQQLVENGQPTQDTDYFAEQAEVQWLQDIIDTLDAVHDENVMENLDAYLESLPEEVLSRLETNGDQLHSALLERWEMLVSSLSAEEADALSNEESAQKFPDSLKLRLMREFLEGNPSILLGDLHGQRTDDSEKVVDLQSWKNRTAPPKPNP